MNDIFGENDEFQIHTPTNQIMQLNENTGTYSIIKEYSDGKGEGNNETLSLNGNVKLNEQLNIEEKQRINNHQSNHNYDKVGESESDLISSDKEEQYVEKVNDIQNTEMNNINDKVQINFENSVSNQLSNSNKQKISKQRLRKTNEIESLIKSIPKQDSIQNKDKETEDKERKDQTINSFSNQSQSLSETRSQRSGRKVNIKEDNEQRTGLRGRRIRNTNTGQESIGRKTGNGNGDNSSVTQKGKKKKKNTTSNISTIKPIAQLPNVGISVPIGNKSLPQLPSTNINNVRNVLDILNQQRQQGIVNDIIPKQLNQYQRSQYSLYQPSLIQHPQQFLPSQNFHQQQIQLQFHRQQQQISEQARLATLSNPITSQQSLSTAKPANSIAPPYLIMPTSNAQASQLTLYAQLRAAQQISPLSTSVAATHASNNAVYLGSAAQLVTGSYPLNYTSSQLLSFYTQPSQISPSFSTNTQFQSSNNNIYQRSTQNLINIDANTKNINHKLESSEKDTKITIQSENQESNQQIQPLSQVSTSNIQQEIRAKGQKGIKNEKGGGGRGQNQQQLQESTQTQSLAQPQYLYQQSSLNSSNQNFTIGSNNQLLNLPINYSYALVNPNNLGMGLGPISSRFQQNSQGSISFPIQNTSTTFNSPTYNSLNQQGINTFEQGKQINGSSSTNNANPTTTNPTINQSLPMHNQTFIFNNPSSYLFNMINQNNTPSVVGNTLNSDIHTNTHQILDQSNSVQSTNSIEPTSQTNQNSE